MHVKTPAEDETPTGETHATAEPAGEAHHDMGRDARHEAVHEPGAEPAPPHGAKFAELARLAAGLAHEIKNPLSTMSINLALLEEDLAKAGPGGAREKRHHKRILTLQREVEHLRTIVEDFLRYARGGEVNRAPHDLVALVRQVFDFVELEDTQLGIRHHAELAAGLPLVMLDASIFKQALLNLFVNARQAMPMGGEMIVRVVRHGNFAEITVTDTGVGMTPETLQRCFDVYYSNKKGGTGLGLSTVRRIVEEHDGTITVVSEPGRGTSFSIVLPLLVEIHGRSFEAHADDADGDGA
jgi:signal transduction histidine kinase